ncbi:MAG TPA: thiol reductant ABC exporter subunit CydC [Ktedonobacteraceae bacterium]|jgi:ATP-binding cassette subfamily C protein CydC|nr:thiol reductant ABC exporter subunit CydC [Ktedonobacteraceae bacterium]
MRKHTFLRLLKLAYPIKGRMAFAAVLGFATVVCGVGLLAVSAYLISAAALHPSIAVLSVAIIGVRFFGLSRGIFRYFERLVSHNATFRLLSRLRVWLYEALEPLAPARLTQVVRGGGAGYRSGDLLSRIVSDIDTLQNMYLRVLAPPVVAVLVALGMWWLLGAYAPLLALTFLVLFLLTAAGLPLLALVLNNTTGQRLVRVKAEMNAQVVDSVQGMADSVAFGAERVQSTRIQDLNAELTRLQMRLARMGGVQNALTSFFTNITAWLLLVLAIPLVRSGQLNGVYLALLVLAALSSFEAVSSLPAAFQQLGATLEAARRLFEIVDAQPLVKDQANPALLPECYDLQVQHVSFRYQPDEPLVLRDLTFEVPQGRCIALVGASGAGKSTIANLLLRFWEYQDGHILLAGRELRDYRQDDVHKLMSVVSQDTHLFNTSIRENIRIARSEASDEEVEHAAQLAQIHTFIQGLPHGYATSVGEQGLLLSGGERQRIAIARAILQNAPILILDEATANLDALTEREVMRSLHTLMQDRTTIMITHHLVDMDKVDEIFMLQAGQIVEHGAHYELVQMEGQYWKLWDRQRRVLA